MHHILLFQARIVVVREGGRETDCGGVLIDNRRVLTSAYHFYRYSQSVDHVVVHLGDHDRTSPEPGTEIAFTLSMASVYIHPDFHHRMPDHNIAILYLPNRISWTQHPHLSPACLPPPSTALDTFQGQAALATGWGRTSRRGPLPAVLQEVPLQIVSHQDCVAAYEQFGTITEGMICASPSVPGRDTCSG